MENKIRFFKSRKRAYEFAKEVGGEVLNRNQWEYDVELELIKYPQGLKEMFKYLVVWDGWKWTKEELEEYERIMGDILSQFSQDNYEAE